MMFHVTSEDSGSVKKGFIQTHEKIKYSTMKYCKFFSPNFFPIPYWLKQLRGQKQQNELGLVLKLRKSVKLNIQ